MTFRHERNKLDKGVSNKATAITKINKNNDRKMGRSIALLLIIKCPLCRYYCRKRTVTHIFLITLFQCCAASLKLPGDNKKCIIPYLIPFETGPNLTHCISLKTLIMIFGEGGQVFSSQFKLFSPLKPYDEGKKCARF